MRFLCLSLVLFLCSPLTSWAQNKREASSAFLGKKINNLSFKDEKGQAHSLYDLKDKKAIVLVFFSFECPVSTSYAQPLIDMTKEYEKHGVSFIGLTTNEDDTPAQVAKQAKHFNLNFPVYQDAKLAAANALKADITPECFVLDGAYVLRYRGRIDNSYSERLKKHPQVTKQDLRQVLGELLSGRPVSEPATVAIGCQIQRYEKEVAKNGTVTFHRDVAPILQNHCQQCHRPGEVGPFSLMNYKQAVNWADDIKSYTQKGVMPPWKAVEGGPFLNDRRMPGKDIETLAAWVDGGTPEGDPKDAPPARVFPDRWQLGKPDLVLTAEEDFILGPSGSDQFRCFVLPTHLTEDKYVVAMEVRPSNPRVVHHTLQYIDTRGMGRNLEKMTKEKKTGKEGEHPAENILDQGPGYSMAMGVGFVPYGGLGGWAPGQLARYLPDNSGYLLPKNSDIVMQVHYHRNGRIEKDRTQLGLYFAKTKVDKPWRTSVLAGIPLRFSIPPGDDHYLVQGDKWATGKFTLHTIMPHMHMVGKEIKVTMTDPEGKSTTLVAIKDWDYNWQETYILKKPIAVENGTRFHIEAYYDNSDKNLSNPFNPPRRIDHGEQTFNEMCYVFLGGTPDKGGGKLPMEFFPPKKASEKAEPKKDVPNKDDFKDIESRVVPYKLTDTQHIMVRVKINGKGPYNFIVDTGAPILFVSTAVGKTLGLGADPKGITVLDKLEFEGGLSLNNVKCRVETPFQLEGMNGMGLAGAELHGILGYTVLAKFRMEFDFTKDRLRWTPLDWKPPPPQGIGGKGGQGGLEILGSMMKFLGPLMGLKMAGPPDVKGFLGMEINEKDGMVSIQKVLAKSPAADGGLEAGDRIQEINGRQIQTGADVSRSTAKMLPGQQVRVTVLRGDDTKNFTITAGEGL